MKTVFTILFMIHSQGNVRFITANDTVFLNKFHCHITKGMSNNDAVDNAISLLNWRDKNKVKADTIHIKK